MQRLSQSELGRSVTVHEIRTKGGMRRRLQELGFVPGESVVALFRGAAGGPTAYLINKTVIALRDEDAAEIIVHAKSSSFTKE